jgi:protein arginine kinase activator
MICSKCQERPATVQFTIIVNGKKTELFLCEHCAKENDNLNLPEEEGVALQTMLAGLLSGELFKKCLTPGTTEIVQDIECPVCGLMLSEFVKSGRFGCDECYYAFGGSLSDLFNKMHGKTRFVGKMPSRLKVRTLQLRHIDELRTALSDCIKDERYEEAAKLRDEIKFLEQSTASMPEQTGQVSAESEPGGSDG